jgi:Transposase IS116/IS110/IS902 family
VPRDIFGEGDGLQTLDIHEQRAVSTQSPVRKRGRPRKINPPMKSVVPLSTGAPIEETPHENAAGGGYIEIDHLGAIASPHSNQIGSDAVVDEAGHGSFDVLTGCARPSAPQSKTPAQKPVGGGHHGRDILEGPASPSIDAAAFVLDVGGGGEVGAKQTLMPYYKVPNLAPLIEELVALQRERLFMIRTKNRMMNSTVAYVRRFLNWSPDMSEAERAKINAKALSIVQKVEKGKPLSEDERFAGIKCQHLIMAAQKAREPFENSLKGNEVKQVDGGVASGIERQMVKLAKKLPVWQWASEVKGFGALSLAVIIAETGDLSNYSNPGKVWKRMGLAPYNGKAARTWRVGGGLKAEEWTELGYRPERRSEMFQRVDPLMKHQIDVVRDSEGNDTGERRYGPYGRVYADRKRYELDRNPEMSKMWAHNRASRYMEKRLLKHLWQAWRRQPLTD